MDLSLARCLCSLTQAYQILTYGCITMRQHVVYILYLSMTLTFDLYVVGGGILSVLLTFFILFIMFLILYLKTLKRQRLYFQFRVERPPEGMGLEEVTRRCFRIIPSDESTMKTFVFGCAKDGERKVGMLSQLYFYTILHLEIT